MKQPDKDALRRFREKVKYISEHTAEALAENQTMRTARKERLCGNYADFVRYYFPHYAQAACAPFQIKAARAIAARPQLRAVFEWARGHAKSTHFSMFIPLWLKCRCDLKVMLLVSKNQETAITLLSDLQAELQGNERIIADYGEQVRTGSWEEGRFATNDGCAFFALGRGQSPRGLRHRQHRPDYVVMDDIDDDEMCRNPDRVAKALDWVNSALFFATDMGRGRFVLVGNRISQTSILAGMAEMPGVYHQVVNALDAKGAPSWAAKYSKAEIDALIEERGYRHAQRELFNNPIVEGAIFKREWIRWAAPCKLRDYECLVSYCDPSFKSSATSDYKAIITLGKKGKDLHIVRAFIRKCSIHEMVRYWYDFHESIGDGLVCDYWMEANFLQDMIMEAFATEGIARGYQLPVRADKRKKPDKHARIEAISPLFEQGRILFGEGIKHDADAALLIDQLMSFEKGSRSHDDGPDALEGAVWQIGRTTRRQAGFRHSPRNNRHF